MKKIQYYILAGLVWLGAGCDDFGDINVNPNATETPLTSALLTNALSAMGGATTGGAALTSGFYCQYFSLTQYTDNSLYAKQDVNWAGELSGSIYDLQNIININSDPATAPLAALQGSNNNQIAIARILKAFRFSVLTDRYGDMPYSEALTGSTKPAFDSQEDIYIDILNELKEAVAQFDNNGNVNGDIMYGGDNAKWKKFANSLRLILALRVSEVDATLGQSHFDDVIDNLATNGGIFTSNDDNAVLDYPGTALEFNNPWFGIGADQAVSDVVANWLNDNGDLRALAFGNADQDGILKGFPYGLLREDAVAWNNANPGWSLILNDTYRDKASRLFILTYADVLLAQAEGVQLGWTAGGLAAKQAFYNDAIEASWEQWGVFNSDSYDDFITKTTIALDGSATDEEKIGTMRWLTFYPNGPQGWAEWRRTGYPALVPTPDALNPSKEIPRRFPYPSVEYNYNKEGVDSAVGRQGADTDETSVWWDN